MTSPPIVNTAFVLVSQETAASRRPILNVMDQAIPKLAASGKLERVDAMDPPQVRTLLEASVASMVDVDPKNMPDESLRPFVRPLHLRQVSNSLKHLEALKRVAEASGGGQRFSLIVEDDVLFGEGMASALAAAALTAPDDAELVFLGLPSTRQHAPNTGGAAFDDPMEIFKNHILPACDSYLVTQAGAAKLVDAFMPVRFSAAAQLTYLLRKGVVKSYISVPNSFMDGSKVGIVASSLETNNQLSWNQSFCLMDSLVRRTPGAYTEEAVEKFEKLWESNPFKEHPDALVLLADHRVRSGKVAEARDLYGKALATYEKEGCLVNQSSEWLRRYMAVFGTPELQGKP